MSYLTIKIIKNNPYLYQVRSEREGDRVRQVFERYLGRADRANLASVEIIPVAREKRERREKFVKMPVATPVAEAVVPPIEPKTEEVTPLVTPVSEVTRTRDAYIEKFKEVGTDFDKIITEMETERRPSPEIANARQMFDFMADYARIADPNGIISDAEVAAIASDLSKRIDVHTTSMEGNQTVAWLKVEKDLKEILRGLNVASRSSQVIAIDHLATLAHQVDPSVIPQIFRQGAYMMETTKMERIRSMLDNVADSKIIPTIPKAPVTPEVKPPITEEVKPAPVTPEVTGVKEITRVAKAGEITKDEFITRMLDENAFVRKGDKWLKPDASGKLQEVTSWAESMSKEFANTYDKIIAPELAIPKAPVTPEVTKRIRLTPEAEVQTSYQILKDKLTTQGIDPNVIDVALETYGFTPKIDRLGAVMTRENLQFKLQDDIGRESTIRKLTREILAKQFGVGTHEVDLVLEGGSRIRPELDIAEAKALAGKIADSIKRGLPTRKELLSRYLPEPAIPKAPITPEVAPEVEPKA
jgi:hypothetical protein